LAVPSTKFVALQQTAAATAPTDGLADGVVEEQTHDLFSALVDFVRDPAGLPDRGINSLGRVMWQSAATLETPMILDLTGGMPYMVFAVSGRDRDATAGLVLPRHFSDMVREDMQLQICPIVYAASQIRDFREGRFPVDDSSAIETRAHAYEAQALLALLPILQAEGRVVQLVGYQHELLREFPGGLKSMPPELVYGQELAT
jgi:hypothetical protein